MKKQAINLSAEKLDAKSIVASTNQYQIGGWSLLYNGAKNPVRFAFSDEKPQSLRIKVSGSTGWVRLLRPITAVTEPGVYTIRLQLRSLTENPKSVYEPYVFRSPGRHRFEKHCRLSRRDGMFVTKIAMSADSPEFWIGFETTDADIELIVSHVRLEVIEGSRQLVDSLREIKALELPVLFTEPKAKTYRALAGFNGEYQARINKGELPFLLDYAQALRAVEMPETFLRMVRYLVVHYHALDRPHQATLAQRVTSALLISHDQTLLDLIDEHCPELMLRLDLNPQTLARFAGLPDEAAAAPCSQLDRHAYFAHQNDPAVLYPLVNRQLVAKPDFAAANPQVYCAVANAYAARPECNERYLAFVNKYLQSFHAGHRITGMRDGEDNVLRALDFAPGKKIEQGPLVSIMMSAFNAADTIGYAIRSLLAQTYRNIEVLVCDDGSDDDTFDIARSLAAQDSRVRVFRSRSNQGTYNIRNDLLAEAQGEFLTFQDSDDYALPHRIECQLETLATEQKALCFSEWVRIRPDGSFVFFQDGRIARFCVVSVMAHRSLFDRMPAFRPALVAADTEFYELCKCFLGEAEIAIDKRPLILGLWGEGSLTRQADLTADHNGFVAPRRRAYAEVAARQRVLGLDLVTDADVIDTLKALAIHRDPAGIEPADEASDGHADSQPTIRRAA